jgi:hypothetical protein
MTASNVQRTPNNSTSVTAPTLTPSALLTTPVSTKPTYHSAAPAPLPRPSQSTSNPFSPKPRPLPAPPLQQQHLQQPPPPHPHPYPDPPPPPPAPLQYPHPPTPALVSPAAQSAALSAGSSAASRSSVSSAFSCGVARRAPERSTPTRPLATLTSPTDISRATSRLCTRQGTHRSREWRRCILHSSIRCPWTSTRMCSTRGLWRYRQIMGRWRWMRVTMRRSIMGNEWAGRMACWNWCDEAICICAVFWGLGAG